MGQQRLLYTQIPSGMSALQTPQTLFPGIKPTFWVSSLAPGNLSLLLQMENKKNPNVCFAAPDDDGQLESSGAGW